MRFLIDTCVISELVAKRPNQKVIKWIDTIDPGDVYLSVITIGEIRKGIEKLSDIKRKTVLQEWLVNELLIRFTDRILLIDLDVIMVWGKMVAHLELIGKKMAAMDSLIAAIALSGNLRLVTSNEKDFESSGVQIMNPWKDSG
jgi:tRNA(fMet)-specific endonuclease VapC